MADDALTFVKEISEKVLETLWSHKKIVLIVAAGATYCSLRRWFVGGVCRSKARLDGKTALVTGANCGIGKETARDFAARGARVLMACRDVTKAERAAEEIRRTTGNSDVHVRIVDLSSLQSVRRMAREVSENEKRLDILVNNAGMMLCPHWKSQEGYEMQFAVNYLSHFLLTNLLLDLLKKSTPSRVVILSSLVHKRGKIDFDDINMEKAYEPWMAYAQSKLANVMFSNELSRRLEGTGVTSNALHPGVVQTELGRHLPLIGVSRLQLTLFRVMSFIFIKTPEQGAQTSIYCAVDESLEKVTGKYFSDCAVKEAATQAQNVKDASRLWQLSEQMVHLPHL